MSLRWRCYCGTLNAHGLEMPCEKCHTYHPSVRERMAPTTGVGTQPPVTWTAAPRVVAPVAPVVDDDTAPPTLANLFEGYRIRGVMIQRLSDENARLRRSLGMLSVGELPSEAA